MADGEDQTKEVQNAVFKDLNPDEEPQITEIESLCLQCHKNGITKLLLTKIPFYKEVVIMSFSCSHCHWENNELQPAAKIQEKGVLYRLNVQNNRDLARLVVKTEWASIIIPELDFEIPPKSQEGTVTTVEGVIERAYTGISSKLSFLKENDPDSGSKVEEFLNKLADFKAGDHVFTFVLRDVTGNSFIENICAPSPDPQLEANHFERTTEENHLIGIYSCEAVDEEPTKGEESEDPVDFHGEVLGLPTNCPSCNAPCMTNMKLTQIPHFREIIIMATNCDACGHKTNEVKDGGGIQPQGVKCILKIDTPLDLRRDLVKSDTCCIKIEELDLAVGSYAFGGRYTTVEGLLTIIKEQLKENNPLVVGDSADPLLKKNMESVFSKLDAIIKGERQATVILDDPCGNSYIEKLDSGSTDTNLTVLNYERSEEQNDELGLLDMKVENYEES